jgi:antitoxin component of MazEF toxin-antitoxin module
VPTIVLDNPAICNYNVITMITTIITIGNSRGIRIPKPILQESGLGENVELQVKKGEIRIIPAPAKSTSDAGPMLLSERTLSADWNQPEEDVAWESLQ